MCQCFNGTAPSSAVKKKFIFENMKYAYFFLYVVTYKKLSDTSGLHLRAVGAARIWTAAGCCRWYFTINGVECTIPGAIEGVSYTEHPTDYHFPGVGKLEKHPEADICQN